MQKSQVNRQIVASRVQPRATRSTVGPPATDLLARAQTITTPTGPIRNRRAVRMTGAQRNSIGRKSEWNLSPYAPRGGWR